MKKQGMALAALVALGLAGMAHGAQQGSIQLLEAAGAASTTQDIDVRVRITLAADALPVTFERLAPLFQPVWISPLPLPALGAFNPVLPQDRPFASYGSAGTGVALPDCNSGPSDLCALNSLYTFNSASLPGLGIGERFDLQPGQSLDFTLGVLHPRNGVVPAGEYIWSDFGLKIVVAGFDTSGFLITGTVADFGSTCASLQAACAFTRHVGAVPEPQTHGLMAFGLLALGALRRRFGEG